MGLDLGANSIGWALFESKEQRPVRLIDTGVRVFEEGLEGIEKDGKGKSRNIARREARLRRRQCDRRSRRQAHLARLLQRTGLLPSGNLSAPGERHEFFTALDKGLLPPLQLRADALSRRLELFELGRVFYHLGQKRGFLSNRKSPLKKDEDKGVIKSEIAGLRKEIEESGAQTLGEHFNTLHADGTRVKGRHTARKMYEDEFERIWETQKTGHPDILSDGLKKKIHHAIYFQRPLKSQKELIGFCTLEEGKRRAPWALLMAQRFRYLQKVNDLKVAKGFDERPLNPEERNTLIKALETEGDIKFTAIRKMLNLKGTEFNLERGGEKKLPGNLTASALRDIFKGRWDGFTEEEKAAVVDEVRSTVKDETLKKRGMKAWGLDEEQAEEFGSIELKDGYCNYSKKAIERLVPLLEKGKPLATAIDETYPDRRDKTGNPMDELPPVRSEGLAEIRNPLVERALTELRRVVNAVSDEYGKPGIMRIELARDLKRPAKERELAWKNMRANERKREEAARKILNETGNGNPSRNDILKVLLWEECNGKCPYTGKSISINALLGDNPQFDIEHIIPFDRSLDNSFFNKTLCYAEENSIKGDKTPFEAYGQMPAWDQILERVKNFKGDAAREKYRRFKLTEAELEEILESFSSRQLNDTRYATRLAKSYLGLLYGGLSDDGKDAEGKRRVQAATGQVTAHIRNALGLNAVLSDGPRKSRDDHRHHAVDAVAIALADTAMVKQLSEAAKNKKGRKLFAPVQKPWDSFFEDVREGILGITVSKRIAKRVRGALHEETFYSPPKTDEKGKKYVLVRKGLVQLSKKDIENNLDYLDPLVRDSIMKNLGGGEPKKVFAHPENHPVIRTKDGREIPIHRIRIRKSLDVFPVGDGDNARYVQADSNHHIEIVKTKDKNGNEKWKSYVVDMLKAYRRKREEEPIIKRDHGEGKEFVFSLAGGEVIELDGKDKRELYVVRTITRASNGRIFYARLNDSRKIDDMKKSHDFFSALMEPLRKMKCRKVVVTPLGKVRRAND
ncbi:MAG: type II CRISPR RNA-guided endonuclease Cas9 [Nitrospiraceae bacterium]|nr:type II CRISPR RNA-guided endonuclease Cas9 [Nitrospiraceae bacterium]